MKRFLTFLKEAVVKVDCSAESTFIWKGLIKSVALCNIVDDVIWSGQIQSTALCNFKGNIIWEGLLQSKPIGNIKDGVLWAGLVQETPICHIKDNIVWRSVIASQPVANFSNLVVPGVDNPCNHENLIMWKSLLRSEAVLHSNMKLNKKHKLALAYLFILKKPAKKPATPVNKKAGLRTNLKPAKTK